jgi:hypothetical protein
LFLELSSLVDHQHSVLLLDFHLGSFEHSEQLRNDIDIPCMFS